MANAAPTAQQSAVLAEAELGQRTLEFLRGVVDPDLELDTNVIESGMLDSFHVVELLSFVEREFDLRIEPTDLTYADLESARAIGRLIARQMASAPSRQP